MSTVEVMVTAQVPQSMIAVLQRHFTVHHREHIREASVLHRVRAVVAAQGSRISRDWLALLPKLELLCLTGPQTQGVDLAETARRQITVLPGPDVQGPERADYVLATLLGLCRQWPESDRFVRNSDWVDGPFPPAHRFSGLRVGVVGHDGTARALLPRFAAFGIQGACFVQQTQPDCPWPQVHSLSALLDQSVHALVILDEALAGGEGPIGAAHVARMRTPSYIVCLARSSVLDDSTLPEALKSRHLQGLVLDDYPEAPRVPAIWRQTPRTWVTPAIAEWTEEALTDISQALVGNIRQHFGLPPDSPG
jgi:hydroxypyruvate reductase